VKNFKDYKYFVNKRTKEKSILIEHHHLYVHHMNLFPLVYCAYTSHSHPLFYPPGHFSAPPPVSGHGVALSNCVVILSKLKSDKFLLDHKKPSKVQDFLYFYLNMK